jgi:hypothetical protein
MAELTIKLLSETTFGRGDGVVGLVNNEVEHDPLTGLPFIRGRTLKGLLVEECANILYSLEISGSSVLPRMQDVASWLFGEAGSTLDTQGQLQVGSAYLPNDLTHTIRMDIENQTLTPADVLTSLTTIRYQTALNVETGVADDGSLRSVRVLLRDLEFTAKLDFITEPSEHEKALLYACVKGLRYAGTGRNRGVGRIMCDITDWQVNLDDFKKIVGMV